jgi:hypothetical protein
MARTTVRVEKGMGLYTTSSLSRSGGSTPVWTEGLPSQERGGGWTVKVVRFLENYVQTNRQRRALMYVVLRQKRGLNEELIGTTEYLTLHTRRRVNRRYSKVHLCHNVEYFMFVYYVTVFFSNIFHYFLSTVFLYQSSILLLPNIYSVFLNLPAITPQGDLAQPLTLLIFIV